MREGFLLRFREQLREDLVGLREATGLVAEQGGEEPRTEPRLGSPSRRRRSRRARARRHKRKPASTISSPRGRAGPRAPPPGGGARRSQQGMRSLPGRTRAGGGAPPAPPPPRAREPLRAPRAAPTAPPLRPRSAAPGTGPPAPGALGRGPPAPAVARARRPGAACRRSAASRRRSRAASPQPCRRLASSPLSSPATRRISQPYRSASAVTAGPLPSPGRLTTQQRPKWRPPRRVPGAPGYRERGDRSLPPAPG